MVQAQPDCIALSVQGRACPLGPVLRCVASLNIPVAVHIPAKPSEFWVCHRGPQSVCVYLCSGPRTMRAIDRGDVIAPLCVSVPVLVCFH